MSFIRVSTPLVYTNDSISDDERPVPEMVGCYLGHGSPIVFGSFASLLIFEICKWLYESTISIRVAQHRDAVIVVLTLKKGIQHREYMFVHSKPAINRSLECTVHRAGLDRNHTIVVLYRDGVVFFIIMALSSLANALLMALAQVQLFS